MKAEAMFDQVKENANTMIGEMDAHAEQIRRTVDSAYENASREMKKMKVAAEELVDDGRHVVRRDPLTYVGLAALAGVTLGFAFGLFTGFKSRR